MLDFGFSPAQEEYRAALRRIALEELLPLYQRGDAEGIYPAASGHLSRIANHAYVGNDDDNFAASRLLSA